MTVDTGQSATTLTGGAYSIPDVPIGDRSVTASAGGYESKTSSATVNEGATSAVDFSLVEASVATMVVTNTSFRLSQNKKGKVTSLILDVTVTDRPNPVPGAAVSVEITSPTGSVFTGSALTNSAGMVGFSPTGKIQSGTWTGDVTGVTKENYELATSGNDLSDTIVIP